MSKLKNKTTPFTVDGVTYNISCNMNVVDAIYDEYGSLDDMLAILQPEEPAEDVVVEDEDGNEIAPVHPAPSIREQTRAVDWLLCAMINDAIEAEDFHVEEGGVKPSTNFTIKSLRRALLIKDYAGIKDVIFGVIIDSIPVGSVPEKN